MKPVGKNTEEALKIFQTDSSLQALSSSIYVGEHQTYNPSEVREVDAEDELDPNVLSEIRKRRRTFDVKLLKTLQLRSEIMTNKLTASLR
jgi:hypothetical protein